MELILSPHAKTVPSNYNVVGVDVDLSGCPPGHSCTEEAWAKAERMESEYFDWESYMNCQYPKFEHPEYLSRVEDHKMSLKWNDILQELEPLPRLH